jgi:hypothetical protein
MGRERVYDRENRLFAALAQERAEPGRCCESRGGAVAQDRRRPSFRQRHGIAVEAQRRRDDDGFGALAASQPEPQRQRKRRQHHRAVEQTIRELVGDIRPRRLDGQRNIDVLAGEIAEFSGDDQRRGIGQPQQSDTKNRLARH